MAISPLAGKPATKEMLVDLTRLEREYHARRPDMDDPNQRVIFGTSGHRGSSLRGSFNEAHILAITQAICDYRRGQGTNGPIYVGKDTHALSAPAQRTALEVLAGNGVETLIQRDDGFTPTPAVSHAILTYNRGRSQGLADGIVITPSHNPPEDGGYKYNPPNGGPADTDVTSWIQDRANDTPTLRQPRGQAGRLRVRCEGVDDASSRFPHALCKDLANVIDMECIRSAACPAGRRSARWRLGLLLGSHQCYPWSRYHGGQPHGGSDLQLHDCGS